MGKNALDINLYPLRNFAIDKHGTVDDKPYGGGKGMVLRVEPIYSAVEQIKKDHGEQKVILLSPKGELFNQNKAKELSKLENITIICGRYEGVDHRVHKYIADEVISIGEYILSGGEIPALVLIESVVRLLPGVLDEEAKTKESFENDKKEHPQYTRPEKFRGWHAPEILLSGHHKNIEEWRDNKSPAVEKKPGK